MAEFSGLHALGWHVMLDNWWDKVSQSRMSNCYHPRTFANRGRR